MWKKILIGLIIAGGIGGAYGYYEWNRKPESMATRSADITLSATELANLYNDAQHLGKIMQISGKVENVSVENGKTTLTLTTGDPMTAISCELDPSVKEAVAPESAVVVRGQCDGKLTDVQLSRCVLVK
jgi:hypothetical protein